MKRTMQFGPLNATFAALDTDFDHLMQQAFTTRTPVWVPAADILRQGDDVTILMELPGMDLNDIDIQVESRTLTVSGRKQDEIEGREYLRKEIRRGEFSRSFKIPSHVTSEDITAVYDEGILSITIRRAEEPQAAKIQVKREPKTLVTQESKPAVEE